MTSKYNQTGKLVLTLLVVMLLAACQKMQRPELGDFPEDPANPGGVLDFYVAFDGTSADPLKNAVDSIKANFPSSNPLNFEAGISGLSMKGESQKFIKYAKPNDWAAKSQSFSISFWYKRDGQTKNNAGTNGPEYPISFKSSNGHWSGANMFLLFEGNNTACAIKLMVVDKNMSDTWLTWEGGNSIAGLLNNSWHHVVLVYNAATSGLTLYIDGVANANVRTWGTHGPINIDNSAISEVRLGCGPGTNYGTDDWLSSSWKGNLDQFRMYSKALSSAEVTELYNSKQ